MAYLRLLVNHDDDAAFLRIINTPRREIGPTTLEKLGAYANERHISLFAASSEFGLMQKLSEKSRYRLSMFHDWVVENAQTIQRGDTFVLVEKMLDQIGYHHYLRETSKTKEGAERKQRNVNDLLDWLKRIADKDSTQSKSLDEVVSTIQLMDILERQQNDNEQLDQVSLMTLHAAKGLEFPYVFLVGMEENILPHQNSIESGSVEEERRLAYVGITRAQQLLTFSYCTHRKRYGDISECEPSRFLSELPNEDLEWPQKQQLAPELIKERGKSSLAQLKAMLS